MDHSPESIAAVSVALALAAGMLAQSLAEHLRIPGIVLLLAAGILLGPDLAGVIQPESLGPALPILVGFAVAVILFEGGLNLNVKRLRREAGVIQLLLTLGALITAMGGTLSARFIMDWPWPIAILFGTLVIVTGPTVITPLLRRIKVQRNLETILEAEGVLIDPIGAILAVVALEMVISFSDEGVARGLVGLVGRVGIGIAAGIAGGLFIALALRFRKVVPEGLESVFTLSMILAIYHVSDAYMEESGIMAVTVAGLVVGNMRTRVHRDLAEFKEQLTVMFIGMLFVLLAADVRVESVRSLGRPGLLTVASLMFLVRPVNIAISTRSSELSLREKFFLAWLAPRGIVAAAVASLFAETLAAEQIGGGAELRALVFLVIGVTVLVQGATGGLVARMLGLKRDTGRGYAIFGANELAHTMARLLREEGEEVVFLDSNPQAATIVERDKFKVIFGNVLEERTLARAQLDDRAICLAMTTNEEANLLFAMHALEDFKVPDVYVALPPRQDVRASHARARGALVLFGAPRDIELWAVRFRREVASIEAWKVTVKPKNTDDEEYKGPTLATPESLLLPLFHRRGNKLTPVSGQTTLAEGDVVQLAVLDEKREEAQAWLRERGFTFVEPVPEQAETTA
jgi:NhaP-type Na+/H+ or K+/H+ antiporter